MSATEEGGKVAVSIIDALKTQPMALALIVINFGFLIMIGYILHSLNAGTERKDNLLADLAKHCVVIAPKEN